MEETYDHATTAMHDNEYTLPVPLLATPTPCLSALRPIRVPNVNEGEKRRVSKNNIVKKHAAASSDDRRESPAEGRSNAVMETSGPEKPAASSSRRDPLGDVR